MAISDGHGHPLAVHVASASPHETKLVGPTLEQRFLAEAPQRLTVTALTAVIRWIYRFASASVYSWWLRTTPLAAKQQHKMAAPCAATGVAGRSSVCSRGSITIRRVVIRWEYYPENFLGMVQFACAIILLRYL